MALEWRWGEIDLVVILGGPHRFTVEERGRVADREVAMFKGRKESGLWQTLSAWSEGTDRSLAFACVVGGRGDGLALSV